MKTSTAKIFPDQTSNMILGQLLTGDVTNKRLLRAMTDIIRPPFFPPSLQGVSYVDEDIEIAPGRYEMAPLTFARLLDLAHITPSCRVLAIGTLTGYTAAVISRLCAQVIATETDKAMAEEARSQMSRMQIANVDIKTVPSLAQGYAAGAPFDVIFIHGAISYLPDMLGQQLATQGRLVTVFNRATRPGMKGGLGKGLLVKRLDNKLQYREHFDAASNVLPGFENETSFTF